MYVIRCLSWKLSHDIFRLYITTFHGMLETNVPQILLKFDQASSGWRSQITLHFISKPRKCHQAFSFPIFYADCKAVIPTQWIGTTGTHTNPFGFNDSFMGEIIETLEFQVG